MRNTTVIGKYLFFTLLCVFVLVLEICGTAKKKRHGMFIIMCALTIGWFISEIYLFFPEWIKHVFMRNIGIIFVGFIAPTTFLTMVKFYRPSTKLSPLRIGGLFVIPVINAAVCLSSNYHTLLRQITIVSLEPVRNYVNHWGPWFWVHTAYCYAVILTITIFIIYDHFRLPKFYRLTSTMMIISICLVLCSNLISIFALIPNNIDLTLIAISISTLLIHLALRNNDHGPYIRFARTQVFNYMKDYIFILGESGWIADYNPSALAWFSSVGITIISCRIQDVMDSFTDRGANITGNPEDSSGADIHLICNSFRVILNLRLHDMTDGRRGKIGSIAVFSDVTENRALIERLEAKAGMDPLTGIANRVAYEGAKKRFDTPEMLPVSIVMCDLNCLKQVNDSLGHQYGDMMLCRAAEIFEKNCPPNGFVARIGGDEFIYLLPKTGAASAEALIEQIADAFFQSGDQPFPLSAALGMATKHSAAENIEDMIALADKHMYQNKKTMNSCLDDLS